MTKEEQNTIIKDKWVEHLQREDDIPTDIGDIYRNWLVSKIEQANQQLIQQNSNANAQEQEAS